MIESDFSFSVRRQGGRISKDRIRHILQEVVSQEAADNLADLPKQAMAEAAAQRLGGKSWLPALLRIA